MYRWVQAGGATIEVSDWVVVGADWYASPRIAEVLDKTTPTGQAHQKRVFTYVSEWDPHVETVTLLRYDEASSTWVNERKMTYDYYWIEAYGRPGDLKTIVTQEWDAVEEEWVGDDTNYFRYYTGEGATHQLKRVLLPAAYAAFVSAYGDPDDPQNPDAGDSQTDPISNYTCFYYEYDADYRVSDRVVFGKSYETDYTVTLSRNSRDYNSWHRKTVEARLDGSTSTVYANYLGQAILTDLCDDSGSHWVTYNRYNGDGRLVLTVEPSAFVAQNGEYYDEDLADLIGFDGGDSAYLSNAEGLFQVATYYTSDGGGAAKGYGYQQAVAQGETAARLAPGSQGGPIVVASYEYASRTVGDVTIHPVSEQTGYIGEDGSGAITTAYAYTWYSGTFQIAEKVTTLPAISAGQNGSGTSATRKEWFDAEGHLAWSMDELGRVSYHAYDSLTGQLAQTIEDIDDATADALELDIPAGWTLPGSGGANLVTDYQFDTFGRVTKILGPAHSAVIGGTPTNVRTARWFVYNDAAHEKRSAQGYLVVSTGAGEVVGPISVTKIDRDGRTTEWIEAEYSGTVAELGAAAIAQLDYTAWTTYQYSKTRLVSTRVYHDIPNSGAGTAGTNYDETSYGYEKFGTDKKGRQNRTVAADGTITRVVFDARGNVAETWIGTDDTDATDTDPTGGAAQGNNMVRVASSVYDADGNMSESREYFGDAVGEYYPTLYQYDWRDRLTDVLSAADVVTRYEHDNLGGTVWTTTYASDDFTLSAGELRAQTQNLFDDLGRVYESRVYEVDPDDGTVGAYLPSESWYDARGYVVKTATGNGLFQKYSYDGLGQLIASYTSFDLDETAYADADDVTGDTVVEQSQIWYDAAGQTVATATYQRLPDDTNTTGALSASNSYATAAVAWFDGLGRVVATADYGREDLDSGLTHYFFNGSTGALIDSDADGIPDVAEAAPPEPYPQDQNSMAGIDFQLRLTEYDSAGRAYRSVDNLGRIDQTEYDDAGRVVKRIENYDDGAVDETDTDQDVTVEYEYDSGGRLVTMMAYNAKGDDSDPNNENIAAQATKYLYTSPVNASWQTAAVYPDSEDVLSQNETTKAWTITTDNGDHVSTSYDRLGRTTGATDQRGVVHAYAFDAAGRLAADIVTSLGSSGIVDGSVRRIGTTYDDVGRVQSVTSYSDTSGSTAVNQVRYEYNGWGKLYREYQEHEGAVDEYTTFVGYQYDDGASGGVAKYVRLEEVTYPDNRVFEREVQYGYGTTGAIDDIMSRLASIGDASGIYASYKYLGAGRIVVEDYEDIAVKLDYTADDFAALDRFGRVLDQVWTDYGEDPDVVLDHYSYTYDRAGNRTSRDNELHAAFDEDYTYDGLDRLTDSDRADDFDQSWGLDGLGNFGTFDDDGSSQARTSNAANEITGITGGWISPSYDDAGNMISGPRPGDETTRVHYVYDAWNRLVAVYDDDSGWRGDVLAAYEYDGVNRRAEKVVTEAGGGPSRMHYYYNHDWQLLEECSRDGEGELLSSNQYVWSARYIDAPIARFHDANGDGDLLDAGDNTRYYTGDANYNVTATIDAATGGVVEHYVYTAYGAATVYDNTWANPAAPATNGPLYCGYVFDVETALYHVRNRYYDSSLSTFVSRDPIGYDGGINLFRYCANRPTTHGDPLGLAPNQAGATDPQHLVDRICELERQGNLTADEILGQIAGEHTTNDDRYFYTDQYGWVDIRHFTTAAGLSHGMGGLGGEITQGLGFAVECWQWIREGENDYHSAFSPEDLPSNAAGGNFGEDYVGHYGSLCAAIQQWMNDNGARPTSDPKAGLPQLPASDPSAPGAGGAGSNSSNDRPGTSNSSSSSNRCRCRSWGSGGSGVTVWGF